MMPPQYLASHLRELIAKDPRTNLLDIQVRVVGDRVIIAGSVESATLRDSVVEVVREALPPTMHMVNELCVETYAP